MPDHACRPVRSRYRHGRIRERATCPPSRGVVAAPVTLRAFGAEAGALGIDDGGVVGADVVDVDLQLAPDRRQVAGEEDIRLLDQPVENAPAVVGGEVDRYRALATVVVVERHVGAAGLDAPAEEETHRVRRVGTLDLDDVRTPMGEDTAGDRHEGERCHVNDLHSGQDLLHHGALLMRLRRG